MARRSQTSPSFLPCSSLTGKLLVVPIRETAKISVPQPSVVHPCAPLPSMVPSRTSSKLLLSSECISQAMVGQIRSKIPSRLATQPISIGKRTKE